MHSYRNVVLPTPSQATMSALVYSALTTLSPDHLSWADRPPHKISDAILRSLDQFARRSVQLVPRPVETFDQTAKIARLRPKLSASSSGYPCACAVPLVRAPSPEICRP